MTAYNVIGTVVVGGALVVMLIAAVVGIRADRDDR